MATNTSKPMRNSEPTDSQLNSLMRSAANDARERGAAADNALKETVRAEVQKVRQRYLSVPRATLAAVM
jgi:hypothetical protein